jgi:two-component system, response regulator YesN
VFIFFAPYPIRRYISEFGSSAVQLPLVLLPVRDPFLCYIIYASSCSNETNPPERIRPVTYKVFLVEDEVTTREGIRDNVDWRSMGFELCGEAADGEIALPQIETTQPDVLITDIKMPFMDGLQLCKIIREHMAWMKIIIISGYNDFQYAQTAIKLGVSEYLLKPVSVQDLAAVMGRVAVMLDQEKSERAYLKRLRSQVEDNLALLREKFLLRLVTGGESSISAIEQSQQLGLNILSAYYQVIFIEIKSSSGAQPLDYRIGQDIEKLIAGLIGTNMDVLFTKKDIEEFVLILKGESLDQIQQEGAFLADLIRDEVERKTACKLAVGVGTPQQRLGDLHRSFVEALVKIKGAQEELETGELKKLDHTALRRYLESGRAEDFDAFFAQSIRALAEAAVHSALLKHYVILDLRLAVTQFISELGGNATQVIPASWDDEVLLGSVKTLPEAHAETQRLFAAALAFRDSQARSDRAASIQQAKKYIAGHFADPDLSLNDVAAQVNFSPNHFSAVFSAETGETFRDYLTRMRLEQAKKLLRATKIKCAEVAAQCGYNDPHYFSLIFRKNCGMPPQQYRKAALPQQNSEAALPQQNRESALPQQNRESARKLPLIKNQQGEQDEP